MTGIGEVQSALRTICLLLLICLALVTADAMTLQAEERLSYTVFELGPSRTDADRLRELAARVIGDKQPGLVANLRLEESDDTYYVGSKEGPYMEMAKESGSIWYADLSKLYNEEYVIEQPLDRAEAQALAEVFLRDNGLLPQELGRWDLEVSLIDVATSTTALYDLRTQTTTNMTNSLDVLFSYSLDGLPVGGPGAKARVSFGNDYEIIGFHSVWRPLTKAESYPAIPIGEALARLEEDLAGKTVDLRVRIEYWGESEVEPQRFLQPYYVITGTMGSDGETIDLKEFRMPATTLSPVVRIVPSVASAQTSEGGSVGFQAEVEGGTPPYSYTWKTESGEVLGSDRILDAIPAAAQREGVTVARTVSVTVVDALGGTAESEVTAVTDSAATPVSLSPIAPLTPNDDSNGKECGIEWVNHYTSLPHLHHNDENAQRFMSQLVAGGWTNSFDWGNGLAWEEDFKYQSGPLGGTDFVYIDAVDFAFFSGHGNASSIAFESSVDYRHFYFYNARWGGTAGGGSSQQGDLEWIVLDACKTLEQAGVFDHRWDQAFNGLHYILGFDTTCNDVQNRGKKFAQNMKDGWTIRLAWIKATQATQGNSSRGAYLRAASPSANTYSDHLPGFGSFSADPYPPTQLWYSRWSC
jgi:hypothetical protein